METSRDYYEVTVMLRVSCSASGRESLQSVTGQASIPCWAMMPWPSHASFDSQELVLDGLGLSSLWLYLRLYALLLKVYLLHPNQGPGR